MQRRVYLELATKAYNNNFPPRTGFGGLKESEVDDPRSWFGVTRVYEHAAGTARRRTNWRGSRRCWPAQSAANDGRGGRSLGRLVIAPRSSAGAGRVRRRGCAVARRSADRAKCCPTSPAAGPAGRIGRQTIARPRSVSSPIARSARWPIGTKGATSGSTCAGRTTDLGDEVPRGNIRLFDGDASAGLASSRAAGWSWPER